jgi:hypothetical protein
MPEAPPGEAELRALARRFEEAERRVRALVAEALGGDRRKLAAEAASLLFALRRLDARDPVRDAYLAAFKEVGKAAPSSNQVPRLAASLASKLDRAAQTASANAREAINTATADTLEEVVEDAVTAHVDRRGGRWILGAYAAMTTQTIGRQATSRGVGDAVGDGGKVIVEVSGCDYCEEFEGEVTVGLDPLPPFHPSCTCVAVPA